MWSVEAVFVCALSLLARSEQSFPPVRFVEHAPAGASRFVGGYVPSGEARIVLVTSTAAFTEARQALDPCANLDAIREIASVLMHEEWHVRHGADEEGAYDTQLTTLVYLGARQDGSLYHKVKQAKLAVTATSRRVSRAGMMARGAGSDLDASSIGAPPSR